MGMKFIKKISEPGDRTKHENLSENEFRYLSKSKRATEKKKSKPGKKAKKNRVTWKCKLYLTYRIHMFLALK